MLEGAAAEAQINDLSKKIDSYITEYTVDYLAQKTRDGRFLRTSLSARVYMGA